MKKTKQDYLDLIKLCERKKVQQDRNIAEYQKKISALDDLLEVGRMVIINWIPSGTEQREVVGFVNHIINNHIVIKADLFSDRICESINIDSITSLTYLVPEKKYKYNSVTDAVKTCGGIYTDEINIFSNGFNAARELEE